MTQKIGIFGGTFNPPHNGHVAIAKHARDLYGLEEILFVPCASPSHKSSEDLVSATHRIAMLEALAASDESYSVSSVDVDRGGVSYTIDTIRELQQRNPGAEFYFLIGSDSLLDLHKWKDIYEVLGLCTFVTYPRPGFDVTLSRIELREPWPERLLKHCFEGSEFEVSSSAIRQRRSSGKGIDELVPQAVGAYIKEHKLYLTSVQE